MVNRKDTVKGAGLVKAPAPGALQRFKYAAEIADSACTPCPLPKCAPRNGTVFRLVHNPPIADDFVPNRKLTPFRTFRDNKGRCSGWALSLWLSDTKLREKLGYLFAGRPGRRIMGDHICKVTLAASDGLCSEPDSDGHFGLFEYETSSIGDGCIVVGQMP
jgi:hypothetical protein